MSPVDNIDAFSRFTVEFLDPAPANRSYEGEIALKAPSGKYLTLYSHLVKNEYRPKILPAKAEIDEYSEFAVAVLNA